MSHNPEKSLEIKDRRRGGFEGVPWGGRLKLGLSGGKGGVSKGTFFSGQRN